MELLTGLLVGAQLVTTCIVAYYFYTLMKGGKTSPTTIKLDTREELDELNRLRAIKLTEPLSERTRPHSFEEIVGQDKGVKALKVALCGANPQHVIIYGPPGVGKTAAARLVLEYARASVNSPFQENAPFVEMDATILQFDERSIADPLIGSVHDPIYQGAGAYGQAGIPQPKSGAVTRAHGGILFIDEIGELNKLQMNKLLKVLEDRRVYFSSSYYSPQDNNIPRYIHDIFKNGLPADFRLVGATTRSPEELPPALRSRCTEVFFRSLNAGEVTTIACNTFRRAHVKYDTSAGELIAAYCANGRDTVNLVQSAASLAALENRKFVRINDIEEVIEYGRYTPKPSGSSISTDRVGVAHGLAVMGSSGTILEIEVTAAPSDMEVGELRCTGVVEEEEISTRSGKMRRRSTARASVDNCTTALARLYNIDTAAYDLHINFPGGVPIDGPSAGSAIFVAIYSAIKGLAVPSKTALTGEITIKGRIGAVGGVPAKIEAAIEAGAKRVVIPKANYQRSFQSLPIEIICVERIDEVVDLMFGNVQSEVPAEGSLPA